MRRAAQIGTYSIAETDSATVIILIGLFDLSLANGGARRQMVVAAGLGDDNFRRGAALFVGGERPWTLLIAIRVLGWLARLARRIAAVTHAATAPRRTAGPT